MKNSKIYLYTTLLSFLISYTVIYRLFPNFVVGFFPEALLFAFAFLLGLEVKLIELLIISISSSIVSFVLLQALAFSFFKNFVTFNILLTAIAKGSALLGISNMLIVIIVGAVSNLILNKKKGS
uniref:Uncharacterized protein n=1 Tax=Fervidobacterium nodosum TaxID=2424 RepID=A0A7C5Y8S1_9BACT